MQDDLLAWLRSECSVPDKDAKKEHTSLPSLPFPPSLPPVLPPCPPCPPSLPPACAPPSTLCRSLQAVGRLAELGLHSRADIDLVSSWHASTCVCASGSVRAGVAGVRVHVRDLPSETLRTWQVPEQTEYPRGTLRTLGQRRPYVASLPPAVSKYSTGTPGYSGVLQGTPGYANAAEARDAHAEGDVTARMVNLLAKVP